jgi:hypothetical protein
VVLDKWIRVYAASPSSEVEEAPASRGRRKYSSRRFHDRTLVVTSCGVPCLYNNR